MWARRVGSPFPVALAVAIVAIVPVIAISIVAVVAIVPIIAVVAIVAVAVAIVPVIAISIVAVVAIFNTAERVISSRSDLAIGSGEFERKGVGSSNRTECNERNGQNVLNQGTTINGDSDSLQSVAQPG